MTAGTRKGDCAARTMGISSPWESPNDVPRVGYLSANIVPMIAYLSQLAERINNARYCLPVHGRPMRTRRAGGPGPRRRAVAARLGESNPVRAKAAATPNQPGLGPWIECDQLAQQAEHHREPHAGPS